METHVALQTLFLDKQRCASVSASALGREAEGKMRSLTLRSQRCCGDHQVHLLSRLQTWMIADKKNIFKDTSAFLGDGRFMVPGRSHLPLPPRFCLTPSSPLPDSVRRNINVTKTPDFRAPFLFFVAINTLNVLSLRVTVHTPTLPRPPWSWKIEHPPAGAPSPGTAGVLQTGSASLGRGRKEWRFPPAPGECSRRGSFPRPRGQQSSSAQDGQHSVCRLE